jgi:hypothetical protein
MAVANASPQGKTVADPCASYETLKPLWERARAICSGEKYVKAYDGALDVISYTNILIPFSPRMTQEQYNFYKAEAEFPGISAEFSKMLVGGLLRKPPIIKLPDKIPDEASDWIQKSFNRDDTSLVSFLDQILNEEIITSRAWVFVDHPVVDNAEELTPEERKNIKPYPVIWPAESVINWQTGKNKNGKTVLTRVILKEFIEEIPEGKYHPEYVMYVYVHELDEEGYYQVRTFKEAKATNTPKFVNGQKVNNEANRSQLVEDLTSPNKNILMHGARLDMIPAWPLNGYIDPVEPILGAIMDKECALYNKTSRRNHLLYGASTYTPVIEGDLSDDQFQAIVDSGLGSWLNIPAGCKATILATPTDALANMEKAIAANIEELAKLGIRMLSPEAGQSGIALQLRNASQTARLGLLNNRVSSTIAQVIAFMLRWRYDIEFFDDEVSFTLSEDFDHTPLGADWLRLATEWYQQSLIPRSAWLEILKRNDMLKSEYNDEDGIKEINEEDRNVFTVESKQVSYLKKLENTNLTRKDVM